MSPPRGRATAADTLLLLDRSLFHQDKMEGASPCITIREGVGVGGLGGIKAIISHTLLFPFPSVKLSAFL